MKNYPIKIETGEHAGETVWVHRSIAVVGFVFCKINNEWCVLANQRGEGAPDFQGYWNCPCGYLDFDETLAEACSREIYEETGAKVEPSALYMCSINDDPEDSIIEEFIGDEIVLTLENGFSREVTFYERN